MSNGADIAGSPAARRVLPAHPWRFVIVAVALLAVVNLGVYLLVKSDTSDKGRQNLTSSVQRVKPAPNTLINPLDDIEVDLRDDLTGVLLIDGRRIPEDQLDIDTSQGIIIFRPGPGRGITRFGAGDHTVQVLFWKQTKPEPKTPDSFYWGFRAAA